MPNNKGKYEKLENIDEDERPPVAVAVQVVSNDYSQNYSTTTTINPILCEATNVNNTSDTTTSTTTSTTTTNNNNNNNNNKHDDTIASKNKNSNLIMLKILLKEKIFEIKGIECSNNISYLKKEIFKVTGISVNLQRLIFNGKHLRQDDELISKFNIKNNSSIHLFPIPINQTPVTAVPLAVPASSNRSSLSISSRHLYSAAVRENAQMSLDPEISISSREVRLWSLILIMLSGIAIFNNLSFYMNSKSNENSSDLNDFVTLFDTLCSIGGLKVGQMGLQSALTIDLEITKKYVKNLLILGFFSILMRLSWCVDVISQIKKSVYSSHDNPKDNSNNPTADIDDPVIIKEKDDEMIHNISFQVIVIAIIIVFAWISCILRAIRLRNRIEQYTNRINRSNNVTRGNSDETQEATFVV
jgi:hypothetical protein